MNHIIEFELGKVRERLKAKGMQLELDQPAKDFLINKGYNPDFGARPLRRAIAQHIEDPLAESLLSGEFHANHLINVTRKEEDEHLYFTAEDIPPEPEPEESSEGNENEAEASTLKCQG